jgi:hypothetical protein
MPHRGARVSRATPVETVRLLTPRSQDRTLRARGTDITSRAGGLRSLPLQIRPVPLHATHLVKTGTLACGTGDSRRFKPMTLRSAIVENGKIKSRQGKCSASQRAVRPALLRAGAEWWECRSAHAATWALAQSGVLFRRSSTRTERRSTCGSPGLRPGRCRAVIRLSRDPTRRAENLAATRVVSSPESSEASSWPIAYRRPCAWRRDFMNQWEGS